MRRGQALYLHRYKTLGMDRLLPLVTLNFALKHDKMCEGDNPYPPPRARLPPSGG